MSMEMLGALRVVDMLFCGAAVLAEAPPRAGIDRLDGPTRAKALAALAGLAILGMAMVLLIWMGARYTRRYMNSGRRGPSEPVRTTDWVRRSNEDEPPGGTPFIPPPPD
jgi:hypothetical protein